MRNFVWIIWLFSGSIFTSCENSGEDSVFNDYTLSEWEERRLEILEGMQKAMGELPDTSALAPLNMQVISSLKEKHYTRYTITYTAAENEIVSAYLYVPFQKGTIEELPAMLALHETDQLGKGSVDGQGERANLAYAKELAERGYVVIAPDYPGFGDSKHYDFNKDRYKSGTMKGIFNHIRSIDLLEMREDVDSERIGVIGHSLGGHNALFVGAFDDRLKVVVSSCGWTLIDYYNIGEEAAKTYGGQLGPWAQERYMPLLRDKYELNADKIPFDFDEVIAVLAPRPFFSNAPLYDSNFDVVGVKKGIANASEIYRLLGVEDKLQIHYPDAEHDFPVEVRLKAYNFIDKILKHTPKRPGVE